MANFDNVLAGLTRRGSKSVKLENPAQHSPYGIQNRVILEKFTPDSPDKPVTRRVRQGNLAMSWGLDNLAARIATSTVSYNHSASGWVQAMAVGTSANAPVSTNTALGASTAVVLLSQASMTMTRAGNRTLEYRATFTDGNAYTIREVGLFGSQGAGGNMVAHSTLATSDQVNKGVSDTVNISYQLIFDTKT